MCASFAIHSSTARVVNSYNTIQYKIKTYNAPYVTRVIRRRIVDVVLDKKTAVYS